MKKLIAVALVVIMAACGCTAACAGQKALTPEEAKAIVLDYTGLTADQVRADMKKIAPDLQVFDELTRHIIDNTSVNAALYSALTQSIIDATTRTIHYETDYERESRLQRERAARRQRWSGGGGRASFGGGGGFSGGGGSGGR